MVDRSIARGIVVLRWVRSENNSERMVEIKGKQNPVTILFKIIRLR